MSWPRGRWRDGGLDRITTPAGVGAMWLCGKHAVGPDPEGLRQRIGPEAVVVCLNQPADIERYRGYADWLVSSPDARWFPIDDFDAPPLGDAIEILDQIVAVLRRPRPVVMHCSAGKGRAGTMAVATLMVLGVEREAALSQVRVERPGAGPEVGAQRELIDALAVHLRR